MNKAQRKIAFIWLLEVLLLTLCAIFYEWISDNWNIFQLPFLLAVILIPLFSKGNFTQENGRELLNRIIEKNPWIKIYFVFYGFTLATRLYFILNNNIDISVVEMVSATILLLLPILIVKQKEVYIEAGKET